MCERKTTALHLSISAGTFMSFEEAIKESNAIKIWIDRLCEKEDYSCACLIGVSKNNPNSGYIATDRRGTRGRPYYFFKIIDSKIESETEPHIHVLIVANPGHMLCKELKNHINNKYKSNVVFVKTLDNYDYLYNTLDYIARQSINVRVVDKDSSGILKKNDLGLSKAVNEVKNKYRIDRIKFNYQKNEICKEIKSNDNQDLKKTKDSSNILNEKTYVTCNYEKCDRKSNNMNNWLCVRPKKLYLSKILGNKGLLSYCAVKNENDIYIIDRIIFTKKMDLEKDTNTEMLNNYRNYKCKVLLQYKDIYNSIYNNKYRSIYFDLYSHLLRKYRFRNNLNIEDLSIPP